jgi:hypothetical protein
MDARLRVTPLLLSLSLSLSLSPPLWADPEPSAADPASPAPETLEGSWEGELPIGVKREAGLLVFTLTEPWVEAQITVNGCATFSDAYGPSKVGRVLSVRATDGKPCEVDASWARPDLEGVTLSFVVPAP